MSLPNPEPGTAMSLFDDAVRTRSAPRYAGVNRDYYSLQLEGGVAAARSLLARASTEKHRSLTRARSG